MRQLVRDSIRLWLLLAFMVAPVWAQFEVSPDHFDDSAHFAAVVPTTHSASVTARQSQTSPVPPGSTQHPARSLAVHRTHIAQLNRDSDSRGRVASGQPTSAQKPKSVLVAQTPRPNVR
jgi:hypothetical protein